MRDMQEIKALLQKNNEILLKLVEIIGDDTEPTSEPTLTVETPPEPTKPTLEELQNSVRSGLARVYKRGEDHAALTTKLIGLPLKANEMDEAQCIVMLEDEAIQ
jgi:hypothetical protein